MFSLKQAVLKNLGVETWECDNSENFINKLNTLLFLKLKLVFKIKLTWFNLEKQSKATTSSPSSPVMVGMVLPGWSSSSVPPAVAQERSGARPGSCSPPPSFRESSRSGPAEKVASPSAVELPLGPALPQSWKTPLFGPADASWIWVPPGHSCSSFAWWRTGAWPCCWTQLCSASPPPLQCHHHSSHLCHLVWKSSAAKW